MKNRKRLAPLFSVLFLLPSCAQTHYSSSNYGYGTFWYYHLFEGSQKDIEELEQQVLSSSFICDSDALDAQNGIAFLNKENHAKPAPFLHNCLEFCVEMQEKTGGFFSPFTLDLKNLWLDSLNNKEVPSQEDIQAEVFKIESTSLSFVGDETIKEGEASIDLGGVGKGYCLDNLVRILKEKGLTKYWISGGGSSIAFGENPNGKNGYTKVELEDLPGKYVYCKNEAISTSSCKKQLYTISEKRYSHIVNPYNGSAEVNLDAVIVKGSSAAVCDCLSTAIYAEGINSIGRYEKEFGVSVIAIKGESVVYCSDGFQIEG